MQWDRSMQLWATNHHINALMLILQLWLDMALLPIYYQELTLFLLSFINTVFHENIFFVLVTSLMGLHRIIIFFA